MLSKIYKYVKTHPTFKILYNKIPTYIHNSIPNDSSAASFQWLTISVDCFSILFPNPNLGILNCGTKNIKRYKKHKP